MENIFFKVHEMFAEYSFMWHWRRAMFDYQSGHHLWPNDSLPTIPYLNNPQELLHSNNINNNLKLPNKIYFIVFISQIIDK